VVDEAKNIVEGSLVGKDTETKIDFKSDDDDVAFMTIGEALPSDVSAEPNYVPLTLTDTEYDYSDKKTHNQPSFGKTLKKTVTMTVFAILLMILGAFLYHFIINNNNLFMSYSSIEQPANITATIHQPVKNPDDMEKAQISEQNSPSPDKPYKATEEIPTLREEMTEKSSKETLAATNQQETNPPQQQIGRLDIQPSIKTENSASGVGKPDMFFPYSLRASSYQQADRALQEITEIRKLGLTPYLVKADLGDMGIWWRIYIGFYSTEEDAKKIQAAYQLPNTTVQKTGYACLIDEYPNETETRNMFEKLKETGYFPYAIQKGKDRYGLYIGAYEKKSEAESHKQDLIKNRITCEVVKR
jgi:cell division protein FtsN